MNTLAQPHTHSNAKMPMASSSTTWTLWHGTSAVVCGLDPATAKDLLALLQQEFPGAILRLTRDVAPR